jgi:hypothetical protein
MHLALISEYLNIAVAIVLVARLLWLGLFWQYRVFAIFLLFDISISALYPAVDWHHLRQSYGIDYRIVWLAERPFAWVLYIWVVYALLNRILTEHYGILRISRKVLFGCFIGAVLFAAVNAEIEWALHSSAAKSVLGALVRRAVMIERACLTTSLLLLGAMLGFLLWFPVLVTRNIALLCAGFLIFYATDTAILFCKAMLPAAHLEIINIARYWTDTFCLLIWLVFVNQRGELRRVRPGHIWQRKDQERILDRLEAINTALLRSARR